ncbi:MAG: hypothetical protein KME26_32400 [Oscillatoria princeps RMCB-10]|nr:hypothetical protein [Oscillatoria princeps RMCB-10]
MTLPKILPVSYKLEQPVLWGEGRHRGDACAASCSRKAGAGSIGHAPARMRWGLWAQALWPVLPGAGGEGVDVCG